MRAKRVPKGATDGVSDFGRGLRHGGLRATPLHRPGSPTG